MRGVRFLGAAFLVLAFMLSGCVMRTYEVSRERVDQQIEGNRGYIMGSAKENVSEAPRKATRKVRVVEFELGKSYKAAAPAEGSAQVPGLEPVAENESVMVTETDVELVETPPAAAMRQYTVGKGETLQKISEKFYGTTRNWYKIYQANKDTLKGPNKIYPGQVINIPELEGAASAESASVPGEGLK